MHPDRNFILDELNEQLARMKNAFGRPDMRDMYEKARAQAVQYATILTALEI